MQIIEVSAKEYSNIFPEAPYAYNTVAFNELNEAKCDRMHFLVFRDSKARLGIITGERDNKLQSPFSAPFGGFTDNRPQPITAYIAATEALKEHFSGKEIAITLPPAFYAPDATAKSAYALEKAGAKCRIVPNYHFDLTANKNAESALFRDARHNLAIASSAGFRFHRLTFTDEHLARVYRVIAENRKEKGYHLAMTEREIANTISAIMPCDLFAVKYNGIYMASAIVYRPAHGIAQVIYWGDTAESRDKHPMAILCTGIFNYYKEAGLAITDAGPAGDFDKLNEGLCIFKEHLGCIATVKRQYIIQA